MQNKLKTAIRFDDFYAVYGSQGVVAMAWWLGAKLADEIRTEQGSFPFLQITGGPRSGKSFLQSYLWKLLGEDSFSACAPEHATRMGRLRTIANAGKQVITFDSMPTGKEPAYDWDELKCLFDAGSAIYGHAHGTESISFNGAVVISSNPPIECSDAVSSRIVTIRLPAPSEIKLPHAIALQELKAEQAGVFNRAVEKCEQQILSTLSKLAPDYTASLLDAHADQLTPRAAKNGGQLMALAAVLSLLLDLSREQYRLTLNAAKYAVCSELVPY